MINIDRILNIQQSYTQAKISALNKEILRAQYAQSAQINALQREMSVANSISREILRNQIKEIENKEKQKFYKASSFNMNELIAYIVAIQDASLQYFLFDTYYPVLSTNINEAIDSLEEIHDKMYCRGILEKIEQLKESLSGYLCEYQQTDFARLLDMEKSYRQATLVTKSAIKKKRLDVIYRQTQDIQTKKASKGKTSVKFWSVCSAIAALSSIPMFIADDNGTLNLGQKFIGFIFWMLLPSSFLFFSIRKRLKWKRDDPKYFAEIQSKIDSEKLYVESMESEMDKLKASLDNHPYNSTKENIAFLHPDWEKIVEGAHLIYAKVTNNHIIEAKEYNLDPLFEKVAQSVVSTQFAEVRMIQRLFSIGPIRASLILDQLQEEGIVYRINGNSNAKVLIRDKQTLIQVLREL